VQPGGVVHFASPELHEGTEAEVIVLVAPTPSSPEPARRLARIPTAHDSANKMASRAASVAC